MPNHCDIFFKTSETSYHHSLTAVGYGQVMEGPKNNKKWDFPQHRGGVARGNIAMKDKKNV